MGISMGNLDACGSLAATLADVYEMDKWKEALS